MGTGVWVMKSNTIRTEFSKPLQCDSCGKLYHRYGRKGSKTNFCSKICSIKYRRKELPISVIDGYLSGISIYKLSKKYKAAQKTISDFLKKNNVKIGLKIISGKRYNFKKNEIYDLYVFQKLSIPQIAVKLNCGYKTISRYLDNFNIIKRKLHPSVRDLEWLKQKYEKEKLTMIEISKQLGCSETTVLYYLKKFNIARRKRNWIAKGNKRLKEYVDKSKEHHWSKSKEKERVMMKLLKSLMRTPTNFEKKLMNILNQNFPNEWKYTGDGSFLIGYKNPDFINCNGKKICIEVFHNYFKIREYGSAKNYIEQRSKHFAKYGYTTIFFDESEYNNPNIVVGKINGVLQSE